MSIVLAEDKQYYQDATAVYAGAETIFQDEDTQPIEVPIIAPKRCINFDLVEDIPKLKFTYEYLAEAMKYPGLIRSVGLIGPLHSGKTSFMDMFVQYARDTRSQREVDSQVKLAQKETQLTGNKTTDSPWDNFRQTKPEAILSRYTDTRFDERERGVSVKATPLSYMLPDSRGKSYLVNLIDTPGHVNFRDEADTALCLADGVFVVVDAVMGVSECVKRHLKHLILDSGFEPSSLVLVITQLDRLVLEQRLPPTDAYFKLRYIIDDVNAALVDVTGKNLRIFKPEIGNVIFASGKYRFAFTLPSFARDIYINPAREEGGASSFLLEAGRRISSIPEESEKFAHCLWGNIFCDSGEFTSTPPIDDSIKRTFVEFVLDPLYKILGACVSEEKGPLRDFLAEIGVFLPAAVLDSDVRSVITAVMHSLLGGVSGVVDAITAFVPDSVAGSVEKISRTYTGSLESPLALSMKSCSPSGPLAVHCVKSIHNPNNDCCNSRQLARVYSGTLKRGSQIRVLGDAFCARKGETEDSAVCTVSALYVPGGRYMVEVEEVPAGNWVVIEGIDQYVRKTCTLVDASPLGASEDEEVEIFSPIKFSIPTVAMKVACEPLQPSDLPRLVEALRRLDKAYPQLQTRVEESGEHVIVAPGELYLDCALHDLRKLYGGESLLEIRLCDPVAVFNETVMETSQFQCWAATPNKQNALSFTAEPCAKEDTEFLMNPFAPRLRKTGDMAPQEKGWWEVNGGKEEFFLSKQYRKERVSLLTGKCGWDELAARNLWAFGPDWDNGSCLLLNDTLPDEVSKGDLADLRSPVVEGFQWATREGPLIEEPVRGCKIKLIDAVMHGQGVARGSGQLIPAACRAVYASILTASPRLMEPVNVVEIDCPNDAIEAVVSALSKRRGHVVKDVPKPGTPFTTIIAFVPLIDSFGFETDLRLHTKGKAFGMSWFDHWAVVPGDPLDTSVELRPLEPVPQMFLARDFLVKTRRRKGLSEEVVVQKYVDDVVSLGLGRETTGTEY